MNMENTKDSEPTAIPPFAALAGSAAGLDPYEAFFEWCKANGFQDVAECEVEDLDVSRMDAAVAAYALPPNDKVVRPRRGQTWVHKLRPFAPRRVAAIHRHIFCEQIDPCVILRSEMHVLMHDAQWIAVRALWEWYRPNAPDERPAQQPKP